MKKTIGKHFKKTLVLLLVFSILLTGSLATNSSTSSAASVSDIKDAIFFGVDFYNSVSDFYGLSKNNAQLNHIKNVRLCGAHYYNRYTGKGNIKTTVQYIIDSNALNPVNLGLKSSTSKTTKQERIVVYILNCISDYDWIKELYGQGGALCTNAVFSNFGVSNPTASWYSLTSYGTSIVNKSHKTGFIFTKTVYDYDKNIYRALIADSRLAEWKHYSAVMKNITAYNASQLVSVASDFLY